MRFYQVYKTPIGEITLVCKEKVITELSFGEKYLKDGIRRETELLCRGAKQLAEYFEGHRKQFSLPLEPEGTEFQKRVWTELQRIPYGETRSYKEIACAVGNANACRAVGTANNRNPIAILIPCHRVIGSNGALIGYAGGLHTKDYLLRLEKGSF
ncbi:MAG: methylated-DNA--[protein]-cysteine S-methyltransferase [Lachnospiraceae bacterium]